MHGLRKAGGVVTVRLARPAGNAVVASQHERILALQRAGGNRAVSESIGLVREVVRALYPLGRMAYDVLGAKMGYPIMAGLVWASHDLGTIQIRVRTEEIKAETAALLAETRRIERVTDHSKGHPGPRGHEKLLVLAHLAKGNRDEIDLTDEVFFERHPDRRDAPLKPNSSSDRHLVREWIKVRRGIVRPTLDGAIAQFLKSL